MSHTDTLPECNKPELKLTIWPDECLKYAVAPFPEKELGSKLVRNTAGGMIRSMYKHHGVGLAAQQAAVPFQIFVMDAYWVQPDKSKHPRVFLNPEITDVGKYVTELPHPGEGCLSFPYDFRSPVKRCDKVELQWLDFKGEVHHEWFDGYEAIIVQHEMDHLTGHCFIDRLSQLKQGIGYRRARKMRRRYYGGMKQGMKMFKSMQKGPEALADRQRLFEMNARKWNDAVDAADLALVKERLAESTETVSLEDAVGWLGSDGHGPVINQKLREATKKYKEAIDAVMDKNDQLYTELAKPEGPPNIKLNKEEADRFVETMMNPPAPNEKLQDAAKRYKEAIEDGTLEIIDEPSGDSEELDTRPSSRFTEGSRRLVQREDARRDRQRVQLPVSDTDQEGDERTESGEGCCKPPTDEGSSG